MSDLSSQNDSRHSDLTTRRFNDDQPACPEQSSRTGLTLKSLEQSALVAALLACAAILVGYVAFSYNRHDSLIDIDEMEYRPTRYVVNINTATWPELANIPGVGPNLAKTIVEHRSEFGAFSTIDEFEQVPGIGEVTLEELRPYLLPIVSQPPQLSSQ